MSGSRAVRLLTRVLPLALLVLSVLLALAGAFAPLQIAFHLLVGWAYFLFNVVPLVRVDPAAVATAAICLLLFWLGAHRFATWCYREIRLRGDVEPTHPVWRQRWSVGIVVLVPVLFAVGIAMVGIVHQATWLARQGPFVKRPHGPRPEHLCQVLWRSAIEKGITADALRGQLRRTPGLGPERYELLVFEHPDGAPMALLVLDRDPKATYGPYLIDRNAGKRLPPGDPAAIVAALRSAALRPAIPDPERSGTDAGQPETGIAVPAQAPGP